jgi:hypothetical protein
MIFTIEESFLTYDLSDRDAKLWAVLPSNQRPLCIRDDGAEFDTTSIWFQFDLAIETESDAELGSWDNDLDCSPDSLLDRFVKSWNAESESRALLVRALDPNTIGRKVAELLCGHSRLARGVAAVIANSWSKGDEEPAPSSTGASLLARAGAIASEWSAVSESETIPMERISALPEMLSDSSHR